MGDSVSSPACHGLLTVGCKCFVWARSVSLTCGPALNSFFLLHQSWCQDWGVGWEKVHRSKVRPHPLNEAGSTPATVSGTQRLARGLGKSLSGPFPPTSGEFLNIQLGLSGQPGALGYEHS